MTRFGTLLIVFAGGLLGNLGCKERSDSAVAQTRDVTQGSFHDRQGCTTQEFQAQLTRFDLVYSNDPVLGIPDQVRIENLEIRQPELVGNVAFPQPVTITWNSVLGIEPGATDSTVIRNTTIEQLRARNVTFIEVGLTRTFREFQFSDLDVADLYVIARKSSDEDVDKVLVTLSTDGPSETRMYACSPSLAR